MRVRWVLLGSMLRTTLPVTALALPVVLGWTLLERNPLVGQILWPGVFVMVHSFRLTSALGRYGSRDFAHLYGCGFGRDVLWVHVMLATTVAVFCVWAPGAVAVATPLRSLVQDHVFRSPYYPMMAMEERALPLMWVVAYAVLLPPFHYIWIRDAQPRLEGYSGRLLAVGLVVAAFVVTSTASAPLRDADWFGPVLAKVGGAVSFVLFVTGWILHRTAEVRR